MLPGAELYHVGPDDVLHIEVFDETELTGDHFGDAESKKRITGSIPAGRFARTEEIAHAVLFLAARDSSYVSGAALEVYGGGEWPPTVPQPDAD